MSDLTEELRVTCQWCSPCRECLALMRRAAGEIEVLQARLAVKCAKPDVCRCALLWQEDANQRQLASVSAALAAEFPFGCDTVEHLAAALLAARRAATAADIRTRKLRVEIDRLREEIRCSRPPAAEIERGR